MPRPRVLLMQETAEGWFLFGYAADGTFSGDTWHESADDALHQAEREYAGELSPWREAGT